VAEPRVADPRVADPIDRRWYGWAPCPASAAASGAGPWLELSHTLRADLSHVAFFPDARFERIATMPRDPMNATAMHMVCHYGTHVDAPCHFIPDGPAFHEIPLERLYGPGVVWRLDCAAGETITARHLAAQLPRMRPGDIVLLDAGWAARFGRPEYDDNPALDVDAARWLVAQGAKLVGVDFATPDLAVPRRPRGFDWPVHHVLLGHGVLIAEHLTNLRPLAGRRIEAMFLALAIEGSDGGPARVIARALADAP
jgi:kynurenine formamidase